MINFQELEKVAEFKNGELNWLEGRDINAVYVILVGDEYYIGSSHYTYLRIGQHLDKLLKGNHHSRKLQDKFNKSREFEVYSLDRGIERKRLQTVEFEYIKKFKPSLNIIQAPKNRLIIKEAMKKYGTSVIEVAEKMGISRVTLSTHINGNPSTEILLRIADAIGCDVTELFLKEELNNTITCPKCGAKFELKEE
ncbi:MAG: helix-turn-helix domain-containing protein [Bacteroidaceae bacterium]|nr:helix-turn-helix domain-containing protein [Bacteroidaceae bacterium]